MSKLEAIRARAKAYAEHGTPGLAAPADRRDLLVAIDAVKALHYEGIAYADDVPEGGNEPVPEHYERHYCHEDGERWPCQTIQALEVK